MQFKFQVFEEEWVKGFFFLLDYAENALHSPKEVSMFITF